ncbi:Cathepsin propeptide inhibitor domain (I29) [Nesidiocoris tenuis]|uniref:Cathepsin propeptide inhibitor domain (I29) n=1 Tax=Nesidiocoris tenuis TaxID=355587 RepID=A0ABN7B594_9HEMI|nr:Cathepsin propeptide inhibitor domain (I29) [Nesidiocoris tenuis]
MRNRLFVKMGLDEEFQEWKSKYNKAYKTQEEEDRRKQLWVAAKERIETHNKKFARGETTFSMALNNFADLEPHEMPRGGVLKNN